jgi:hypothetical protein
MRPGDFAVDNGIRQQPAEQRFRLGRDRLEPGGKRKVATLIRHAPQTE